MAFLNRSVLIGGARVMAIILAGAHLGAGPFSSGTVKYVLELFTSQGCSSCPPADLLLATMARQPDAVVVSFPVDYWDYIGWKDTLASPAFTERQKAYAAAHRQGHVYTPQVIVNGLIDVAGSNRDEIGEAIQESRGVEGALSVPMHLSEAGGRFSVEVAQGGGGPAGVFLLRVARARTVQIKRGENAGRTVTYTNVVRAIDRLGDWNGETTTFDMPSSNREGEGFVVLVQKGTLERPGVILGAAKTEGL